VGKEGEFGLGVEEEGEFGLGVEEEGEFGSGVKEEVGKFVRCSAGAW